MEGLPKAPRLPVIKLGDVLSANEAKEFAGIGAIFVTIFEYVDLGITHTNAYKTKAVIWSDIDDDDIKILVDVILSGAKKSRILATGVRQIAKAHHLLRLGMITAPRFMETVRFYAENGGFVLPWTIRLIPQGGTA